MTKQTRWIDEFLYDLLRFAVTVVLMALIILGGRSGDPTPTLDAPASSSVDH